VSPIATSPVSNIFRLPRGEVVSRREGKLFKRDFGGFWWDVFPELTFVDGGFFWKRATGLDDLTWWLFAKNQR